MEQLGKAYDAKAHEDALYQEWEESGFFNPDKLPGKRTKPFTIVIPPPNVTGQLHIGHAMMLAIQDLMIRFERMRGKKALWLPGFDHASIATQNVVEKKIWKEEKKTRHDLGREEFLRRVDTFVEQSKDVIRTQVKKMGASCDWSRARYTLDAGLSIAVQTMFVRMYEDGLIYRGNRIVNWCTRCASTLADDEVSYREERSRFYYLKYGPVVIGTARPETKFLDKVIVVHPDDTRYTKFVGKEFAVEWIDGKVRAKVVADAVADPALGTGAMTITPAHSFEDFALAQKYGFDVHEIIGMDGKMTAAAGEMAGLPVDECRRKVVERLQAKGLIDRIDENYVHNLSVCYRCDTPIQPLVSKQWFVAVDKKPKRGGKSLKALAIDVVRKEKIAIVPDRFNKTYFQWMENLHDWCISRQIWFGHRIPVWYNRDPNLRMHPNDPNKDEAKIYVGLTAPQGEEWEQDPDTLDTWFSSALWTFSTLGWPMNQSQSSGSGHATKKNDLQMFHPTSVMETGYDILFFWVARMIMMTTYALDEIPFKTVYLHGLVRDKLGRKMSKSLGNGIDPLDVIAKYGADPVRLSLIIGSTPGNDVRLYDEKIAGFRNFVNKLWNIGRFILSQQVDPSLRGAKATKQSHARDRHASLAMTLSDRWILSRLHKVIASVTDDLEHFRFSQAGETLREFTWSDFADWYLEIAKCQLSVVSCQLSTQYVLNTIFNTLLRLWHPFTPYVTEVLWKHVSQKSIKSKVENLLIVAEWPRSDKKLINHSAETSFELIRKSVTAFRNARATYRIPVTATVNAMIVSKAHADLFTENQASIIRLAHLASCTIVAEAKRPEQSIPIAFKGATLYLLVGGIVDIAKEQERIKQDVERQMAYVSGLEKRLMNEEFTSKAPVEIVEAEKAKWDTAREELERLRNFLT
ncbi:valine--tRNA ligase [Candidatus Uhrbacteria bacterium]|nr:valine--tRNA ligase [Candidatus Uhrbacteria bacterium]